MLVAQLAVATGISPLDLLNTPTPIFRAMIKTLEEQRKKAAKRG